LVFIFYFYECVFTYLFSYLMIDLNCALAVDL